MATNKPKQGRLVESKLDDLQDLATEYAEARDSRTSALAEEVRLKGELLTCMKSHKLKDYVYEDLEVHIVHEKESVKVRIRKPVEEETEE